MKRRHADGREGRGERGGEGRDVVLVMVMVMVTVMMMAMAMV